MSVLVIGSINVDLYQRMSPSSIKLAGSDIDVAPIRGMTLPAKSFVANHGISEQLSGVVNFVCGEEETLLLQIDGPFEQKTGGKGANAAAAAGQSFRCELICNMGKKSAEQNKELLADLKTYGNVDTRRSEFIDGPTGTAYILLFADGDNAILLLGGANQSWPSCPVAESGSRIYTAIEQCVALMLQREIPDRINVEVARIAKLLGKPVFMDVGGTDAPLDENLMPYISVIAPNESELAFISGVELGGGSIKDRVRKGVAALKAKFELVGNSDIEVLVTLGSQGSMHFAAAWTHSGVEDAAGMLPHEFYMGTFRPSTENGKPADTTGAGDCYRGSFVAVRYGEGKSLAEAMKWASAAGSLSVGIVGAMPSMPLRCDIEERVKQELVVCPQFCEQTSKSWMLCCCRDSSL